MADIHRFRDRAHAGALLARRLRHHAHAPDAIVLALPRGGVPVGFAIASRLGIALDVLVVRKLGMPRHEELAMGAVGSGGVRVLQPGVPGLMGVTEQDVEAVTARELAELARRELAYRGMPDGSSAGASGTLGGAPAAPDLRGKTAILVDDGIATGSTVQAAIQVVRRMQPRAGAGDSGRPARHGEQAGAAGRRAGLPVGAAAVPLGRTVVRQLRPDQRRAGTGIIGGRPAGGVPSTNRRTEE
jgi:predicted phosphoribosyltransferase